MSAASDRLGVYLHLARASQLRGRMHVRDRLLVLAAVVAAETRLARIAGCCRRRILDHNARHLIGRWPDLDTALRDEDFTHFLRHLQRRYPRERAERMLASLGIELGQERAAYYSDEEYAAALLGVTEEQLREMGGE